MPKYYIQVEAVNMEHVIFDTHDISTIRGGSFMLLDAMKLLTEEFEDRATRVTSAASQGLFWLEANGGETASAVAQEMLNSLDKSTDGHAIFVAAVEADVGAFGQVLERLQAQIRRKQWMMPTVSVPAYGETQQECFLDGWRPGAAAYNVDDQVEGAQISEATLYRRRAGLQLKHELLSRISEDEPRSDDLSAKDLGELASNMSKGILHNKIAYIHVDGNSFGRIRKDICDTREKRTEFDQQIQVGCREKFLKDLLQKIDNDDDFLTNDRQGREARRLELLLWGGDEFTMIVPAWRGFQVLETFYEQAKSLTVDGVAMSHRAAIVFAHHNTPILQIRRIAEALLDQTRDDIKDRLVESISTADEFAGISQADREESIAQLSSHRYGNAFHYLALESFDMLRGSLSGFLEKYYRGSTYGNLLMYAEEMRPTLNALHTIRKNVARGKVLKMVDALQEDDRTVLALAKDDLLRSVLPEQKEMVSDALNLILSDNEDQWYWVADLWDYIPEWNV